MPRKAIARKLAMVLAATMAIAITAVFAVAVAADDGRTVSQDSIDFDLDTATVAEQLAIAWRARQPLPLPSLRNGGLDSVQAYRIQREMVGILQSGPPAGFKAGLTQPAAWRGFGLTEPVAGVLPFTGALRADSDGTFQVDRNRFARPMLEVELGFRLGQAITAPIADVASLRRQVMQAALVTEIVPVVEFPDLGFADRERLRGVDIIAANVAARYFLEGVPLPAPVMADPNGLAVTLRQGERQLATGVAGEVMGDQWRALLWLINHSLAQGWALRPGQLLITGAIGPMLPLHAGCYEASWDGVQTLRFCAK